MDTISAKKLLLCFAHFGEAQAFLQHFQVQPSPLPFLGLYQGRQLDILITGEGIHQAGQKLAGVLGAHSNSYEAVYNFGIGASTTSKLALGQIVPIRTVYCGQAHKMEYHSYTCFADESFDCVSAGERVFDFQQAEFYGHFAQIIDRELWGLTSAAKLFQIPIRGFKLISDEPWRKQEQNQLQNDLCQMLKENALQFSDKLLKYFLDYHQEKNAPLENELATPAGLHLTQAMSRKYQDLLKKLIQVTGQNQEQVLSKLNLQTLLKKKTTGKAKALELIMRMERQLNPMSAAIEDKLLSLTKPFEQQGLQIRFDKNLEDSAVEFRFSAKSQSDFQKKKEALEQFNYHEVNSVFEGRDV